MEFVHGRSEGKHVFEPPLGRTLVVRLPRCRLSLTRSEPVLYLPGGEGLLLTQLVAPRSQPFSGRIELLFVLFVSLVVCIELSNAVAPFRVPVSSRRRVLRWLLVPGRRGIENIFFL